MAESATVQLVEVQFHGDTLQATQDEAGDVWVSIRRVCEALGLAEHRQQQKLQAKAWAVTNIMLATGPDGKSYQSLTLHLDSLPLWLATIEPARVKEEIREKLVRYQREASKVLADHFLGRAEPSGLNEGGLTTIVDLLVPRLVSRLGDQLTAQVRGVVQSLAPPRPERMWTVKERCAHVGWFSVTEKQRNQIREKAVAKLARLGFGRPMREGPAPGCEMIFPESQVEALDEAVHVIWEESLYRERGGMFAEE